MSNHVHLLLEEGDEDLSLTMKRLGVSFVWFYNWKYETTGHLFQDRYNSERVEDERYLKTVVRYIHQNPVKAGIVKNISDWPWSSYTEYYQEKPRPIGLLDHEAILGLFDDDRGRALIRFREFHRSTSNDNCLDEYQKKRLTDGEARNEINNIISGNQFTQFKSLSKQERDELLLKVTKIEGISKRQIARIIGISPSLIFKL
jgi:hypothetical protein